MTQKKDKTQFFWHIHHDKLVEPLIEPIKNRIEYIKTKKPQHERELRLRLIKKVKGKLPAKFDKAGEARDKAGKAYDKAREECKDEIEKLHKKECPECPFNGKTIFSGK